MANDIIYTSNPADIAKLEGLYIMEKDPEGVIQGVDFDDVGLFGQCVRGPLGVKKISSVARLLEVYGGRDYGSGGALVGQIWAALVNKRFGSIYVRRVTAAAATTAAFNAEVGVDGAGLEVLKIAATSPGIWGALIQWSILDASNGDANMFNLHVKYLGDEVLYENLDIHAAGYDNLAETVGDDDANWVVLTKLASGRPANSSTVTQTDFVSARDADDFVYLSDIGAAYTGVTPSAGSIAASDYITALAALAATAGPRVVTAAESLEDAVTTGAQATLNAQFIVQSANVADKSFVTWSGKASQTPAQEITAKGAQVTNEGVAAADRLIWAYNRAKTVDPTTGLKFAQGPHLYMASILSQTDVDIHPGSVQGSQYLSGIVELDNEALTISELQDLKAAGISTLEKLDDRFQFRSGVTCCLISGREEITRRRMVDYLLLSASARLRYFVKAKGSRENRAQVQAELAAFSRELKSAQRIIEDYSIDQETVNTHASRAKGQERIFWNVDLIDHMLELVLQLNAGTGVIIEAA